MDLTGKFYTDQKGRFTITSSIGNKFILVSYNYYSNTIHAEPLKTQTGLKIKTLYHKLHSLLIDRGLKPSLYILYNECPNVLKNIVRKINETLRLFPPNNDHRNSAERAIHTLKDHLIYGLYLTHKDLPLHLWYQLLPHASLTIN